MERMGFPDTGYHFQRKTKEFRNEPSGPKAGEEFAKIWRTCGVSEPVFWGQVLLFSIGCQVRFAIFLFCARNGVRRRRRCAGTLGACCIHAGASSHGALVLSAEREWCGISGLTMARGIVRKRVGIG